MSEIHCIKNARNQKSTFDLKWGVGHSCAMLCCSLVLIWNCNPIQTARGGGKAISCRGLNSFCFVDICGSLTEKIYAWQSDKFSTRKNIAGTASQLNVNLHYVTPRGSGKTVSTTGKNESISIFSIHLLLPLLLFCCRKGRRKTTSAQ